MLCPGILAEGGRYFGGALLGLFRYHVFTSKFLMFTELLAHLTCFSHVMSSLLALLGLFVAANIGILKCYDFVQVHFVQIEPLVL